MEALKASLIKKARLSTDPLVAVCGFMTHTQGVNENVTDYHARPFGGPSVCCTPTEVPDRIATIH